jgi:hypothetical protein
MLVSETQLLRVRHRQAQKPVQVLLLGLYWLMDGLLQSCGRIV